MAPIQIQILSDLHLEAPAAYDVFTITPSAPILALLGDIGYISDEGLLAFLRAQLSQFRLVLFVQGNHEPYGSSWPDVQAKLRTFSNEASEKFRDGDLAGEFALLDQRRYDLSPAVTILGCTLFSKIMPEQTEHVSFGLNDFYRIRDWTVEMHDENHLKDVEWLNTQVRDIVTTEPHRQIIILTHHSPCTADAATDPKHRNSPISSGFVTDLTQEVCWTSTNVVVWAFGHTHYNCDFRDPSTGKRLVTNQRGYYFAQAAGFDAEKLVSV